MSSRPSAPKGRITSSAMRHNNSPIVRQDIVTPFAMVGIVGIRIRETPSLAVVLFALLKPLPLYLPLEEPSDQRSPHHHQCLPQSERPGAREPGVVNYPAVDCCQFQANQVCRSSVQQPGASEEYH